MELKKLQTLAEGKNKASVEARRLFDSVEGSLGSVALWIQTGRIADFLEKHNFPATESKAFTEAFRKLMSEFEDLKMAVITGVEDDLGTDPNPKKEQEHALNSGTRKMFPRK